MLVYATVDGETQVIRVDTGSIYDARDAVVSHYLQSEVLGFVSRIFVVVK